MRRLLALNMVLLCMGCEADEGGSLHDALLLDSVVDAPDDAHDGVQDTVIPTTRCAEEQACNALLLPQGECPGECFAQPHDMVCRGAIHDGVCYRDGLPEGANQAARFGELEVLPTLLPGPSVAEGEVRELVLTLKNHGSNQMVLSFEFRMPDTWQLVDSNFSEVQQLVIPPGAEVRLEATLQAMWANILAPGPPTVISFNINRNTYEVFQVVGFGADAGLLCDGRRFPETWCDPKSTDCQKQRAFYHTAMCCDGVFYPGAFCCADVDCIQGSCIDGKCVADAILWGNTLPHGHQRVLVVLADSHPITSGSLCDDRSLELAAELGLAEVEAYFDEVTEARTGRRPLELQWSVLAGVETEAFLQGSPIYLNYVTELEAYLVDQGCVSSFAEFDKVIMVSPRIDLEGFSGRAMARGRIAMNSPNNPLLTVHELGHTFGASDLYLDLGGSFTYKGALMGNNIGRDNAPTDAVLWGEIGLGDLDRSGVIDLFEFAAEPERLAVRSLTANLTTKDTLELTLELGGEEEGVLKRILLDDFTVSLPDFGAQLVINDPSHSKVVVFGLEPGVLDALRQEASVRVRVVSTLTFTDQDFRRQTLDLDETIVVPLSQ